MNAVAKSTLSIALQFPEAHERLCDWGYQCGPAAEAARFPYRETRIKEIIDVGRAWRQKRETAKQLRAKRKAAARAAAETRRKLRAGDVKVCGRCGLVFVNVCRRCAWDPKYTAMGKQTRSFIEAPLPVGPAISAAAAQIDAIVGSLKKWQRDVIRAAYVDQKPWRVAAAEARISLWEFERALGAAVERVSEQLATRNDSGL